MSTYDPNYKAQKIFMLVGQKAILLNKENKILLLQRSEKAGGKGLWSLPGGALEKEDPIQGILREIEEECQITKEQISDLHPFALRSYESDGDFVVIIGYIGKLLTEEITLDWENDNYKFVTREEALEMQLSEDARWFIEKL